MPETPSQPETADDPAKDAWEKHRQEQARFIAENTTPEQRLAWLEEMLVLMQPYLPRRDGK